MPSYLNNNYKSESYFHLEITDLRIYNETIVIKPAVHVWLKLPPLEKTKSLPSFNISDLIAHCLKSCQLYHRAFPPHSPLFCQKPKPQRCSSENGKLTNLSLSSRLKSRAKSENTHRQYSLLELKYASVWRCLKNTFYPSGWIQTLIKSWFRGQLKAHLCPRDHGDKRPECHWL